MCARLNCQRRAADTTGVRSEHRFEQLYHHGTAAILTVGPDGRIVDCNGLACRLLMRAREEILGTPLDVWVSGADRGATMRHVRAAFEGTTSDWYASVPRLDGARRQVIVRLVPDTPEGIERVHALIVTPVQAGSIGAGEALRPLLENLPNQFALVLDADDRIRYATGLARTHWVNPEDVLGAGLTKLLEPAQTAAQTADMKREVEAGRPWTGQQRHRRADGSTFHAEVYALPYRDAASGTILGTLYAGRDISTEQELRTRSERADRFAAIGDVVVSVAVELQRALNGVNERAVASRSGADPALLGELHRVSELVEKLLAFASVRPLEQAEVAAGELVDHVLKQMQPEIDAAGVRVISRFGRDLPQLRLDEGHMTRLVRELVQNGIDAMNAIGAHERELRISGSREGEHFLLAVEDRGPGIPAAVGDRIFEPFYTTRPGRFGLGLPIVRGIVAAHGGRVSVRGLPTGGTRALVQLPVRAASPRARFRAVPLILRSRSVLLVEDDENVRRVIRKALETTGYRVTEAFSGRSALSKLTTGEVPDLIITDLKMSGGNGYWLIDKLRSEFPALHARTIIITGDASETPEQIERATGCTVLGKPVAFPALLEAMEDLLTRSGGPFSER